MNKDFIISYYDFLLYEKKGIPEFLEKEMKGLNFINFKETIDIILPENDISKESIIKILYKEDIKSDDIGIVKNLESNFRFDDFNFEFNKFTKIIYNFLIFKNTKKKDFIKHLSHEIHHAYQLYNVFKSTRTKKMNKNWELNLKQQKFRGRNEFFDEFLYILYKSLGSEIDADIVGLYFKIKEIRLIEKDSIVKFLKTDNLYKDIKIIENFKPKNFIDCILDKTNKSDIDKIINEFNGSDINIKDFFEKWNVFFKKQSKKYNEKINRIIDLIVNERNNESRSYTDHNPFPTK